MNTSLKLSFLLLFVLVMTSCAQISGLQTARTVGKENGEIGASIGALSTEVNGQTAGIGSMEIWGRYGVAEKVDLGLKLSTTGTNVVDLRWQIIGNRHSLFAAGVGVGTGVNALAFSNGFQAGILDFHLPIYTSMHLGDGFALYFSPRAISTVAYAGNQTGRINYAGASAGFVIGKKLQLVTDYSYFTAGNEGGTIPIQQLSVGLKLALGNN